MLSSYLNGPINVNNYSLSSGNLKLYNDFLYCSDLEETPQLLHLTNQAPLVFINQAQVCINRAKHIINLPRDIINLAKIFINQLPLFILQMLPVKYYKI